MIVVSTTVYIILIHSVFAILSITPFYFASYAEEWDWLRKRLNAGCTATSPNQYGIPELMICPKGMFKNFTYPPS